MEDADEFAGGVQVVTQKGPVHLGVTGAWSLLGFGKGRVEVGPEALDVAFNYPLLDVGQKKTIGVAAGGIAEDLGQSVYVICRVSPDFCFAAD